MVITCIKSIETKSKRKKMEKEKETFYKYQKKCMNSKTKLFVLIFCGNLQIFYQLLS